MLVDDREHFLAFDHFPWFKQAPVAHVLNVQRPSARHLYWPDLDVDLAVESIEHPELFPLVSETQPNYALQRKAGRRDRRRHGKPAKGRRR